MADIAPNAPVHAALCLVDAELPLFGKPCLRGYPSLNMKPLAKRINAAGPLTAEAVKLIATARPTDGR